MTRQLDLNSEQRDQIAQILDDTREQMYQLHHQYQRDRHQTLVQAFGQIRAVLTPEQKAQFDRKFASPAVRHHDK
jgi:Spy/CpxP family protein refolding chaperone